jgi:hypothetical protein
MHKFSYHKRPVVYYISFLYLLVNIRAAYFLFVVTASCEADRWTDMNQKTLEIPADEGETCNRSSQTGHKKWVKFNKMQCTYNLTLRHVRVTIVAINIRSVYVCSISYSACNAHAPYCRQSPAPVYNIFPHYLINSTIFEKKNCWTWIACFGVPYKVFFLLNTSDSEKNWARCDKQCVFIFM